MMMEMAFIWTCDCGKTETKVGEMPNGWSQQTTRRGSGGSVRLLCDDCTAKANTKPKEPDMWQWACACGKNVQVPMVGKNHWWPPPPKGWMVFTTGDHVVGSRCDQCSANATDAKRTALAGMTMGVDNAADGKESVSIYTKTEQPPIETRLSDVEFARLEGLAKNYQPLSLTRITILRAVDEIRRLREKYNNLTADPVPDDKQCGGMPSADLLVNDRAERREWLADTIYAKLILSKENVNRSASDLSELAEAFADQRIKNTTQRES